MKIRVYTTDCNAQSSIDAEAPVDSRGDNDAEEHHDAMVRLLREHLVQ